MLNLARLSSLACAAVVLSAATPCPASAAGPQTYPFTPEHWTFADPIKVVEHRGVQSLEIPRTQERIEAVLKGVVFTSGTIELDVEGTAALGPSVGFRRRDDKNFELFYVRPGACPAGDCVQYAPWVKGVLLWDLYPGLQAAAGYKKDQWNHLKLVVSGRRLRAWVNGGAPALDVTRLEGDTTAGAISLLGAGFIANVKVTPGAVEGLPPAAGPDPTAKDARLVRNWAISPVITLADGATPDFAARPTRTADWTPIPAETGGLINISRRYVPDGRSLVWLRTTITAAKAIEKRAAIGWNDEVWVFVNGKQIYADQNLYLPAEKRKTPDGRLSLENGSFALPLNAGRNEVVVGVANAFFGWGLMLRLDDPAGVTLTASTR